MKTSPQHNTKKAFERKYPAKTKGFTLLEMVVVVVIIGLSTVWALPQLQRQREQSFVDQYSSNLDAGLRNSLKRLQKTSKKCTLFPGLNPSEINMYRKPNELIELSDKSPQVRKKYLDCLFDNRDIGLEADIPFRYLLNEGTGVKESVEVLVSRGNHKLNNRGHSAEGKNLVFRIRSKQWNKERRLKTRCVTYDGSGTIIPGIWSYTQSMCNEGCPEGDNCNGATID